jgi:hypothetical protein
MKFTPVPMRRYRRPCLRQYHGASPLRCTLLEQLRNSSSNQITLKSSKLRCAIPEPSNTHTHTHFRCRVQRKLFVGTTATKEHATHHYNGHNANSSQTSDPKNRGNLRENRYLTCIYISSRLISRAYEVAILRFSVAFQCK